MDNQTHTRGGTYGQSYYSSPKPNTRVIPVSEETNIIFTEDKEYKPTHLLVSSYVKALEDRKNGLASPVFSSVEEMKKWFDGHE